MDEVNEDNAYGIQHGFCQWVSEQATLLRTHQWNELDLEHIIEELNGLSGKDRRELRSRLQTMLEHLLKRDMFPNDEALRGWNITISRSAQEINAILDDSPSLLQLLSSEAMWTKAFRNARKIVAEEYKSKTPDEDAKLYFG